MAEELNGCGHNVVVRNGKKGGLRVHRNVPCEVPVESKLKNMTPFINNFFNFPITPPLLLDPRMTA